MRSPRSGVWRQVTWDDALDRIAERMRAVGREAAGVWSGHGFFATNYGTRINSHLLRRFANLYGCQWWNPTMICWGLGAFGLGITGVLETNTKEDMGQHANFVLLWGANLASQPNTSRHLAAARHRGARVVAVDVRETEATGHADEALIIRPGTDGALALALMHVIVGEQLHDRDFVARHTAGFDELAAHVGHFSPAWAAEVTGIPADRIVALARAYAAAKPAMIVMGGSSMHKGPNGWQAARAIGCLPALTGNLGVEGGGFGPRHGSATHGQGLASIVALERRPPGRYIPNQMSSILDALGDGRVRALLLFGTDMLSSFADAGRLAHGLSRQDLVVSYELFMNDTARHFADVVLPSTSWLEELGCKSTNTHLYLMPRVLDPPGEARPGPWVLRALAQRLDLEDIYPWASEEGVLDALLDHPATGHATVGALRAEGGMRALKISHVAYPDRAFDTPSGKVEFVSERARSLGLPALPAWEAPAASPYPLTFQQGRTLAHFHAFFDHGRALPSLAKAEPEPTLWISPADAAARSVADGATVRIYNERGELRARAHVTLRIPAGAVWMHDGWEGINRLTSGRAVLPDEAVDLFHFSAGQSAFDARVEVAPA
jgi:anaerobic selenocysteine-containing dehydrogenase